MNVLITGAASRLGRQIAAQLGTGMQVRLLDDREPDPPRGQVDWVRGSLLDPDTAKRAVHDVDAVIHTGEPPPMLPDEPLARDETLLDLATRGTHVLFTAGVRAGVKRFVCGSTLEVFAAYPESVYIGPLHRPEPQPEVRQMTRYLGEVTCREFARDHLISVTVLRLGRLVLEEEVGDQEPDLMWLDLRDAARAFCAALARDTSSAVRWAQRFAVYHLSAPFPNPRFLVPERYDFDYRPEHSFQPSPGPS